MDELFRFVLQRPANRPEPTEVKQLAPTFVQPGEDRSEAKRKARELVRSDRFLRRLDGLAFVPAARAVAEALAPGPLPTDKVRDIVKDKAGNPPDKVVADPRFGPDEARLADSLVAMKLLSESFEADAPELAKLTQGYDAIRSAAVRSETVTLRPLAQPFFSDPQVQAVAPVAANVENTEPREDFDAALVRLDEVIEALRRIPAAGFAPPARAELAPAAESQPAESQPAESQPGESVGGYLAARSAPSWTLTRDAAAALPAQANEVLAVLGLDTTRTPLPQVLDRVQQARVEVLTRRAAADLPAPTVVSILGDAIAELQPGDLAGEPAGEPAGDPAAAFPNRPGNVRPVGVGDLLLVKEHTLRYEGGELAHVENILATEKLSRETRRLERTETSVFTESETTKTEERDTQTTDRFSLKRETSETVRRDTEFKAGLAVTARYGPFIEVKANADFATKTARETSVRQSTEFGKDVVDRSVSKVVERVLERRSVTTVAEFEEKYTHGFDNTRGDKHVAGVYQWIDKISQAQVYNYGKRMLFDVTVPEPSAAYIEAQLRKQRRETTLVKPPEFTLAAGDIDEGNYLVWGNLYDVADLKPPLPLMKSASKAFSATMTQGATLSSAAHDLPLEDGYAAKYAAGGFGTFQTNATPALHLVAGQVQDNVLADPPKAYDMNLEVESLPISYYTSGVGAFALTLEVWCERTARGFRTWQIDTHDAITQGYLAKVKLYEQALAEARAAAGVVISGRNPVLNKSLIANELRKQSLTLLTAQHFDEFGALETSEDGYPQPNLFRTETQMPYVRFFEQAFEWEHLAYFHYPYFWGLKKTWFERMLLDDVDPDFSAFLRAGATRVVFPVRPGFESAVVHYLETGEIWNGGPAPDVTSPFYVPIVKEIQEATGAPGAEQPQGKPWLVKVPTTLVRLRPNNDLPAWKKVGEEWVPTDQLGLG